MKYSGIREEELKNKVSIDLFKNFDSTKIIGDIDFSVYPKQSVLFENQPLLWAETKTGDFDISKMFVQLILTIGKARTFANLLPPTFLGAFDFKKISFISYLSIQDIFYINDFNWNVAPSNHQSKEFKLIKERIDKLIKKEAYIFDFIEDTKTLNRFINNNISKSSERNKIKIDKNNFIPIYLRWIKTIKPIIDVDWEEMNKINIQESDFFLADIFVDDKGSNKIDDDISIKDNLFVSFHSQGYKIAKSDLKQVMDASINIRSINIYEKFWRNYKRPPLKDSHDFIIKRRDLIVPQDIRERKGAFFTPSQWVELSQKYLTDVLGENWQDEYYIWDCASGTGNLLAGFTNKYNIFSSTIDKADINVIHERIDKGANLLKSHVFQFDFLNDDNDKLPITLQNILNDKKKRSKLIFYINPPYAEASSYGKDSISQVATETNVFQKYKDDVGAESLNELFAQFFIKIHKEYTNSWLASFSTPKFITSNKFIKFRNNFKASFKKGFVCPAYTFDNVKGKFPIAFLISHLDNIDPIEEVKVNSYEYDSVENNITLLNLKNFSTVKGKSIGKWRSTFYSKNEDPIAYMVIVGPSMQSNNNTYFTNEIVESYKKKGMLASITFSNIIPMVVYYTIRKVIKTSWLNNKDSYLYPNDKWHEDIEFQNDCLMFALFTNSNNVQTKFGKNHWIPFTEKEVNSKGNFESNFMSQVINGTITQQKEIENILFENKELKKKMNQPLLFSDEAKAVFESGLNLWKYYHSKEFININASFYDIKEYFQGRNEEGRMNSKSNDEKYTELIGILKTNLKILSKKITPKVFDFEFLK